MSPTLKIGLVLTVFAGGAVALLLNSGAGDALTYSKLVDEVMADPSAFRDRQLRVEGQLVQGSIRFREEPCEWRFVLEKNGRRMPVRFPECVVPDTFRDGFGIDVTVQGRLESEGAFLANEVIPRCPSKYEMQQRANNGEAMPHGAPAGAPPAGFDAQDLTPPNGAPAAPQPAPSAGSDAAGPG